MSGITVVVGNPKAASRTRALAGEVAGQVAARTGVAVGPTIELADHTSVLFDWSSAVVADLVAQVLAADVLVVASPTYKATYTGLLKVFVERFDAGQLAGLPAIPVMTGAGAGHALAVEHALRPLLIEIGASTPTRGLYVRESELVEPAAPVRAWLEGWGATLAAAVAGRATSGEPPAGPG